MSCSAFPEKLMTQVLELTHSGDVIKKFQAFSANHQVEHHSLNKVTGDG
jgi:hypothetical protein